MLDLGIDGWVILMWPFRKQGRRLTLDLMCLGYGHEFLGSIIGTVFLLSEPRKRERERDCVCVRARACVALPC